MKSCKSIFRRLLAVILIVFVAACSDNQCEQKIVDEKSSVTKSLIEKEENELPWEYPVTSDMEQRTNAPTGKQTVDTLQISQDKLSASSTKDAVNIYLNYPLFTNYLTNNDSRRGLIFMIEMFNEIKELYLRVVDGAVELINTYKNHTNE